MNFELFQRIVNLQKVIREIPEITYGGNPVLRMPTKEVSFADGVIIGKKLSDTLLRYKAITGGGIGLAAPQIGESSAVFVTYINDEMKVYINPVISERSSTQNYFKEICISFGVVAADVLRHESIVLEWTNESDARESQRFEDKAARVIQHEMAHLNGRLNVDDAEPGTIQLATFGPGQEVLRKA